MKDDGGPAFPSMPQKYRLSDDGNRIEPMGYAGMSLRDWFASHHAVPETLTTKYAEALAGRKCPTGTGPEVILDGIRFWMEADAAYRYIFADAMLEARKK